MSHEGNTKLKDQFFDELGEPELVCEHCHNVITRHGPDLIDFCEEGGCGCVEGSNNPMAYFTDFFEEPILETDTVMLNRAYMLWLNKRGEK